MKNFFLAQELTLPGGNVIQGPVEEKTFGGSLTIGSILSRAIPIIFIFAGVSLLLMIVMSGFTFLTSAGDSKKMEQGKNQLTNAIIGFIIIFAAFWIVQIFGTIFGLESMTGLFK
jgi:hypothetical protein